VLFRSLEAGTYFRYRLPETFAGYARSQTDYPVEYPTACSPQAWAAGTPLLLIRVMLGLEPDGDRLSSDPVLPEGIDRLDVTGIPGRWGRADVTAGPAPASVPTREAPEPRVAPEPPPVQATAPTQGEGAEGEAAEARRLIQAIPDRVDSRWFEQADGTYALIVAGLGAWRLQIRDGVAMMLEGQGDANLTVSMSLTDYLQVARGELNPQTALLQRRLRVTGDLSYLVKLSRILRPPQPAPRSTSGTSSPS